MLLDSWINVCARLYVIEERKKMTVIRMCFCLLCSRELKAGKPARKTQEARHREKGYVNYWYGRTTRDKVKTLCCEMNTKVN